MDLHDTVSPLTKITNFTPQPPLFGRVIAVSDVDFPKTFTIAYPGRQFVDVTQDSSSHNIGIDTINDADSELRHEWLGKTVQYGIFEEDFTDASPELIGAVVAVYLRDFSGIGVLEKSLVQFPDGSYVEARTANLRIVANR